MRVLCSACAGAEVVSCAVTLLNSGHMTVSGLSVTGADNNCSTTQLAPSATQHCSMWAPATAADGVYELTASVSGTALGPKPLPAVPPAQVKFAGPEATVGLLQVSLAANATMVTKPGEAIMLTVTAVSGPLLPFAAACGVVLPTVYTPAPCRRFPGRHVITGYGPARVCNC